MLNYHITELSFIYASHGNLKVLQQACGVRGSTIKPEHDECTYVITKKVWKIKNYFSKQPEMPVSALKEFIQTTRKFAIPLFEYLDSEGYTERSGDVRKKGYRLE